MSWIKIDDQFADHPKIVAAGPLAGWLNVCALCYCGRYLTDGFVSSRQVRKLIDVDDITPLVTALVTNGLWDEVEGGYQIHDYLQYNPSREKTLADRKANAKRQAEWQERKEAITNGVSNGVNNSVPSPSPIILPTVVAEKPAVPGEKKPGAKTQMMNVFLEVSNMTMPTDAPTIKLWWSKMHILYGLADKNVEVGKQLIRDTVKSLRADEFSIGGPESIIKTARNIMAQDTPGKAVLR